MYQLIPVDDAPTTESERTYRVIDSETGEDMGKNVLSRDEALALKARLVVGEITREERARAKPARKAK